MTIGLGSAPSRIARRRGLRCLDESTSPQARRDIGEEGIDDQSEDSFNAVR
jgi:hypothetical protein